MSRITTLHPRTYNEARVIGENFRDGVPVIMNLSEMDDTDAKRLVDFAAGLVFSVRGTIERVTNKVFLLSPPNVSVDGRGQAAHRRGRVLQPELTGRWSLPSRPSRLAFVNFIGEIIELVLGTFIVLLFVRLIVDWIQIFARSWTPRGPVLVVLEGVYTVTDPPVKALRKMIPPLRLGGVAIDLSFVALLLICYILLSVNRALLLS